MMKVTTLHYNMENEYEKFMIEKSKQYARKQKYYESTNTSTSSSSAHDYNEYNPDFIDHNEYKPKNVFSYTSGVYEDDDDDKPILPKVEKEIEEEHKGPPKPDTEPALEPAPEVVSQPKYKSSYEDRSNFRWAIDKKLFEKDEIQKWAASLGLTNPEPVPVPVPEQDDEDEGNQGDGKIKSSEGLYDDQIDKVMSRYKDFKGCIMKD